MSLFEKWFKRERKEAPKEEPKEASLPWIEPAKNPFGVRLLDLRPVTKAMLATSSDPQCAANAVSYNTEDGTTFIDMPPAVGTSINSNIIIPIDKILAQPGCEGITIYPALDENGKKTLVYAGIDAQKEVITQVPIVGTNGDIRFEEGTVGDRVMNPGGYWNDKEPTQPAPTK